MTPDWLCHNLDLLKRLHKELYVVSSCLMSLLRMWQDNTFVFIEQYNLCQQENKSVGHEYNLKQFISIGMQLTEEPCVLKIC